MIMIRYDMPLAAPRRYILYNSLFPLFLLVDFLSLSIIPYLPRVTPPERIFQVSPPRSWFTLHHTIPVLYTSFSHPKPHITA
jgi:hypothetical protein